VQPPPRRWFADVAKIVRESPRFLLIYPPRAWIAIFIFAIVLLTAGILGEKEGLRLAGLAIALVSSLAIGIWVWILRPGSGSGLVLVARFSESTTNVGVSQAKIHQQSLVDELAASQITSEVEIRKCFRIGERAARTLVASSRVEGVVFGNAVVAVDTVRWEASFLYRLWVHSRGIRPGEDGAKEIWQANPQLERQPRRAVWRDGSQEIRLLSSNAFPADHAVGIGAILNFLGSSDVSNPAEIQRILNAARLNWDSLPDQARALFRVMESSLIISSTSHREGIKFLRQAVEIEGLRDPVLQLQYASTCMLVYAQGNFPTERLARAVEPLDEIDPDGPYFPYMMGCVRMAETRWDEALSLFRLAAADYRFQDGLGPAKPAVISAWLQAADLVGDASELRQAMVELRSEMLPLKYRMSPRDRQGKLNAARIVGWTSPHPYDTNTLDAMEMRLREVGFAVDLRELRGLRVENPSHTQDSPRG